MGTYLNPGKGAFEEAFNSEIFVDKTEMIGYLNSVARTEQKYVCVSRPRRFGKTMATKMICAYYDREADSRSLFEKCKISKVTDNNGQGWDEYLGKFNVIRLVMTNFFNPKRTVDQAIDMIELRILNMGDRQENRQTPETGGRNAESAHTTVVPGPDRQEGPVGIERAS